MCAECERVACDGSVRCMVALATAPHGSTPKKGALLGACTRAVGAWETKASVVGCVIGLWWVGEGLCSCGVIGR